MQTDDDDRSCSQSQDTNIVCVLYFNISTDVLGLNVGVNLID